MATDEWLRVEGCDGVYALGDCATINQRRVMVYIFIDKLPVYFYMHYRALVEQSFISYMKLVTIAWQSVVRKIL